MTIIDQLNERVKLRIAPSPIHGVGVFAIRDIGKGQHLSMDGLPLPYKISPGNLSKLLPEVRELILERWPRASQGMPFAYPDAIMLAYTNHSDDPNYDALNGVTLRDIKQGEEITEDYRKIENWGQVYPWLTL